MCKLAVKTFHIVIIISTLAAVQAQAQSQAHAQARAQAQTDAHARARAQAQAQAASPNMLTFPFSYIRDTRLTIASRRFDDRSREQPVARWRYQVLAHRPPSCALAENCHGT